MATVLDVSLLGFLLPVFVFIFLLVVMFAILEKTKLFGEKAKTLNLMAAVCVAAISIFIGDMTKLISATIPWIIFIAIVMMFIYAIFKFYDSGEEFWSIILGEEVVFILVLLIVFIGITQVFESTVSPYAIHEDSTVQKTVDGETVIVTASGEETNPAKEAMKTIVHPRILGALFMLIITAISVKFLSDKIKQREKK